MTTVYRLAIMLLCTAMSASARAATEIQPGKQVGDMNNAFAIDLYSRLAVNDGNVFFSPTSIQSALTMTWAGARGKTAEEMAGALHLDPAAGVDEQLGAFLKSLNVDEKTAGYQLANANALWGARGYPFKPDYLAKVEKKFAGHLSNLDFAGNPEGSRKTINDWVAKQTRDKIVDLLEPGSVAPLTRLVLTNAIYFKASWDTPFKKALTREEDFTCTDGKKVKAQLMHQQKSFMYAENDALQAVELEYSKNELLLLIILPRTADGLGAFEKGLTTERLTHLTSQMEPQEVNVTVPKFRIETGYGLGSVLTDMGMKLAFDAQHADFSGMTSAEQLALSEVAHKAYVNVDEEGTEAAAATATVMLGAAMRIPQPPKEFKADHPFLFAIVHQKSGAMLFMGRLSKP